MYLIKARNIRGYVQEEKKEKYTDALHYAIECKDSNQYSAIVILEYDALQNQYFLCRIIL